MKTYKAVEPGFICEHGLGGSGVVCGDPAEYTLSNLDDTDFKRWSVLPPGDRFLCERHLHLHGFLLPVSGETDQDLLQAYSEEVEKNG